MTYQLRSTDKLGIHCEDNPHLKALVLSLFELYDLSGPITLEDFDGEVKRRYPLAEPRDLEYAKFQVAVNREFCDF